MMEKQLKPYDMQYIYDGDLTEDKIRLLCLFVKDKYYFRVNQRLFKFLSGV